MGLFKEVHCCNCGVKVGLVSRQKLSDGNYLCSKCQSIVPTIMSDNLNNYTYDEFKGWVKYINEESQALAKIFRESHKYSHLHLDTVNGILLYEKKRQIPIYLRVENISLFDLSFVSVECKSGLLGGTATGKVDMMLQCKLPYFAADTTIEDVAVASAKKKGDTFYYDHPDGMDEFVRHFEIIRNNVISKSYERAESEYQNIPNGNGSSSAKLQQALALFMFDSLSDVTAESLKVQRNRLIKSFHPDVGFEDDTKYAQKINDAYMLLLDYAE